jgi:hypothetical protein
MRALRDGQALEPEDARELWAHFSAWMDEHPGDLAGFAAALGVTSVRPALDNGGAVLVVSTTEAQAAYANAASLGPAAAKGKKREKGAAPAKAGAPKSKGKQASAPSKGKAAKQPR